MIARRAVSVNERGHTVGQDHHRAKFSNHEVDLMIALHAEGMRLTEIAAKFETSKGHVHDLVNGRRRGHVAVDQRVRKLARRPRFTAADPEEFEFA